MKGYRDPDEVDEEQFLRTFFDIDDMTDDILWNHILLKTNDALVYHILSGCVYYIGIKHNPQTGEVERV